MLLLAKTTADHALDNHEELEIAIEDVRMALQDCGALGPEKLLEDQIFEGKEDMRGVEAFIAWADGSMNKEIGRIALEGGDDGKEDYLTG
jgi:transcription initiation factor TFIID subunit 3